MHKKKPTLTPEQGISLLCNLLCPSLSKKEKRDSQLYAQWQLERQRVEGDVAIVFAILQELSTWVPRVIWNKLWKRLKWCFYPKE